MEPLAVSSSSDSTLGKSASYIPYRHGFPDPGPMPPSTDHDALVDWIMTQGSEHWTEEQRASMRRHHSLHYDGVEDAMYLFSFPFWPTVIKSCELIE